MLSDYYANKWHHFTSRECGWIFLSLSSLSGMRSHSGYLNARRGIISYFSISFLSINPSLQSIHEDEFRYFRALQGCHRKA